MRLRNAAVLLQICSCAALVVKDLQTSDPARVYYHRSGTFCPDILEGDGNAPVIANLTLAEPENACTSIKNVVTQSMVLLIRGSCTFEQKVRNVEEAGGKAAIIGNNEQDGGLVIMSADGYESSIPCVMIRYNSYQNIKSAIQDNARYFQVDPGSEGLMKAQLDGRGELPRSGPLPYSLPVKVATLLLIVLPTVWAAFAVFVLLRRCVGYYRARRARLARMVNIPMVTFMNRVAHNEENGLPMSPSESASADLEQGSDQTSLIHATSDGSVIHNNTCAVCLEDFQPRERVKRLPCGHAFHAGCIDPWLVESDKCPICKRSIFEQDQQRSPRGCWARARRWTRSMGGTAPWRRLQDEGYPGNYAPPPRAAS